MLKYLWAVCLYLSRGADVEPPLFTIRRFALPFPGCSCHQLSRIMHEKMT